MSMVVTGAFSKIFGWIAYFINKNIDSETIKCKQCKSKMKSNEQYLALLPVFFDDEHENTAQYYLENALPVKSEDEIPTGRRACYFYVFRCENCSNKVVSVIDFLKVRDQILVKGGDIYPYETFRGYIESHEQSEVK